MTDLFDPFFKGKKVFMELIFLEPIFKERLWGGQKLKTLYNYNIPHNHIGECWVISAHKNGSNRVLNGKYKGLTLDELYKKYKIELFNNDASETFPILVKILDADDDLSIQVHPDDLYAKVHANDFGKTECWYVIDADKDSQIVDGHQAKTKAEFLDKIKNNDLSLWQYRSIKKHDFISIPAKKVHAIGKGAVIYEVQQSSDTTYRIYDYDRMQSDGTKRELHLSQALDVLDMPSKETKLYMTVDKNDAFEHYDYIKNKYFHLRRVLVKSSYHFKTNQYQLCSVLEGHGKVNDIEIHKGDHFIIFGNKDVQNLSFEGNIEIMLTERP